MQALKQPLVWSSLGGGTWVEPSQAIFLPPQHPAAGVQQQGQQQQQQGDERPVEAGPLGDVARLLLRDGLPLVTEVPQALVQGESPGKPVLETSCKASLQHQRPGESGALSGPCWGIAVCLSTVHRHLQSSSKSVLHWQCSTLLMRNRPSLPAGLLRRHPDTLRLLSPNLVRQHFVGRPPASLTCLRPSQISTPPAPPLDEPSPAPISAEAGNSAASKDGAVSAADSAAVLLAYCLSDMPELQAPSGSIQVVPAGLLAPQVMGEGGSLAQLDGLPLLPLLDGRVAVLRTKGGAGEKLNKVSWSSSLAAIASSNCRVVTGRS